jgi:uncharacterized damage-inducible protein DinB
MMRDRLIAELTTEEATTRRVLERVPEDRLTWAPHLKSMTLGQLALHVAQVPGAVAEAVNLPQFQVPEFTHSVPAAKGDILNALGDSMANAKRRLGEWTDDFLLQEWRVVDGARTLLAMPRVDFVRSVMLNHWYHHRGELVVYLRLLDVPIPSVYGPSADENPFAA